MVRGIYSIKGVKNEFDMEGVWLGECKPSSYKDGWQKIGSDWYFYMAGQKVTYRDIYDGGKWYAFDGEGKMVTNEFQYAIDGGYYYYGADGKYVKPVTATGWYDSGNEWYYVNNGYALYDESEYKIGNDYYAFGYDGMMVSNDVYDGRYYGADGKMVTKSGWYSTEYGWVYVNQSGYAVESGIFLIGGKEYAFEGFYWVE